MKHVSTLNFTVYLLIQFYESFSFYSTIIQYLTSFNWILIVIINIFFYYYFIIFIICIIVKISSYLILNNKVSKNISKPTNS